MNKQSWKLAVAADKTTMGLGDYIMQQRAAYNAALPVKLKEDPIEFGLANALATHKSKQRGGLPPRPKCPKPRPRITPDG